MGIDDKAKNKAEELAGKAKATEILKPKAVCRNPRPM